MDGYVAVARVADVTSGGVSTVVVGDSQIALFNVAGRICALHDECTHAHALLSEGEIIENVVTCPLHGAEFDVITGRPLTLPAVTPVQTYAVQVEGETIWLKV